MTRARHLWFFTLALLTMATDGVAAEGPRASPGVVGAPSEVESHVAASAVGQFGGPNSVGGTLRQDSETRTSVVRIETLRGWVDEYFDFKERVRSEYGLDFGLDYNALFQVGARSTGESAAASGAIRFFGRWTLLEPESGNDGIFVYKVENRHRLGTSIAPQGLGTEIGYAGLTAVPFSDAGWLLTNFFWEQILFGGRLEIVAGVVDSTDYVDTYALVNPWTDFSNLAFGTDPTIPAPDQGLGAAALVRATDQVYVLGGVTDANGDPSDPAEMFDSFFDEAEYFSHLEIGWIPSFDKRFTDNLHVTAWNMDARAAAGTRSGWGVAFSFNRLLADRWEPFLRGGYSDGGGALWQGSASVGVGYQVDGRSQYVGLGAGWGRPSEDVFGPGLNDQYTAELFYRIQVLRVLAITPDVQLLIDPALEPASSVLAVFGVRARFVF